MGGGMSAKRARDGVPLKIGLMVPANNTRWRSSFAAWLPAGSTVTTVKIPRGQGLLTKETLPAYRDSAMVLARTHFASGTVDLVAYGCTTAGFLRPGRRCRALRHADRGDRLPVVTTARAMVSALQHDKAKRIAVSRRTTMQ